jgi:outer membrane immunogenic protein
MRISVLILTSLLMTGAAVAGDNTWSGAYVGAHAGGAWGTVNVTDNANDGVPPGPFNYSVSGAFGGATAGYNWQEGGFVLGVEGDLGYLSPQGSGIIGSQSSSHQDLTLGGGIYGDATGRAGFAFGSTMIYAKGGAAFFSGSANQATTNPNYTHTGTGTFTGWTAGGGVEQSLTDNLSVKVEYQHFDFGTQEGHQTAIADELPQPGGTTAGTEFDNWHQLGVDTVKVGLNYHFD